MPWTFKRFDTSKLPSTDALKEGILVTPGIVFFHAAGEIQSLHPELHPELHPAELRRALKYIQRGGRHLAPHISGICGSRTEACEKIPNSMDVIEADITNQGLATFIVMKEASTECQRNVNGMSS